MGEKSILLIEDEKDLMQLYQITLERAGYRVFLASNGMDGIKISLESTPDLILLDLMMPMGDGRSVLSMIRLNSLTAMTPVIIISNLNPGTIDLSAHEAQVVDYWIKAEVTPRILMQRLEAFFTSHEATEKKS